MLKLSEAARETWAVLPAAAANRNNYRQTVREMNWRAGLVTFVADGAALHAARAAALSAEWLLGWPATARRAADFLNYSSAAVQPHSTIVVISSCDGDADLAEAARQARRRGASVLGLVLDPAGEVSRAAQACVGLSAPASALSPFTRPIMEQVALFELVLAAAQILAPRNVLVGPLESELDQLAAGSSQFQIALTEAVRVIATAIASASYLTVAGTGFFDPPAQRAAILARSLSVFSLEACDPETAALPRSHAEAGERAVLLLSAAQSRGKHRIHGLAQQLHHAGARTFALTTANDRDLIHQCELAALLPEVSEIPASLLSLIFLEWLLIECSAIHGAGARKS